jgi:hypothetical protein
VPPVHGRSGRCVRDRDLMLTRIIEGGQGSRALALFGENRLARSRLWKAGQGETLEVTTVLRNDTRLLQPDHDYV